MTTTYVQQQRLQNAASASDERERQKHLRSFAQALSAEIAVASPEHSEEILSTLIAELAMSAADHRRKAERRQKQAEGIAAAKARDVRFGRKPKPLPDNFDKSRQTWLECVFNTT